MFRQPTKPIVYVTLILFLTRVAAASPYLQAGAGNSVEWFPNSCGFQDSGAVAPAGGPATALANCSRTYMGAGGVVSTMSEVSRASADMGTVGAYASVVWKPAITPVSFVPGPAFPYYRTAAGGEFRAEGKVGNSSPVTTDFHFALSFSMTGTFTQDQDTTNQSYRLFALGDLTFMGPLGPQGVCGFSVGPGNWSGSSVCVLRVSLLNVAPGSQIDFALVGRGAVSIEFITPVTNANYIQTADFGRTMRLTSVVVKDGAGNPLDPAEVFRMSDGVPALTSNGFATDVPEPGTAALCLIFAAFAVVRRHSPGLHGCHGVRCR